MKKYLMRLATVITFAGTFTWGTSVLAASYTLLAGPVGGGWYIVAAGMAEIVHKTYPDINLKVVPGGAIANPPRVGSGSADFGLALVTPTVLAERGTKPYKQAYPDIQAVAFGFSTTVLHVVALEDFPFDSLGAAIEKHYPMKIVASSPTTFADWATKQMLGFYGASPADIKSWGGTYSEVSHRQQQELLRNQQANVLTALLAMPATDVVQVASVRKVKFLALSNKILDRMVKELGFKRMTITPAQYKGYIDMAHPVSTVSMPTGLIVNSKVPEDVVYKVTKALFEHAKEAQKIHPSMHDFIPAEIVKPENRANGEIKLAPGAIKYIKEEGLAYK